MVRVYFEVNVYDKERTKQSAGEYLPMRVAIAGKNRVVDHALADRWADILLEKHTDYYTAHDRDKSARRRCLLQFLEDAWRR